MFFALPSFAPPLPLSCLHIFLSLGRIIVLNSSLLLLPSDPWQKESQPVNLHTPHTDEVCVADCLITKFHAHSLSPPPAFIFNPRSPIHHLERKPLSHLPLIHLERRVPQTMAKQRTDAYCSDERIVRSPSFILPVCVYWLICSSSTSWRFSLSYPLCLCLWNLQILARDQYLIDYSLSCRLKRLTSARAY